MSHPRLAIALAVIVFTIPGCSFFKKVPPSEQFVLVAVVTAQGTMGIYSPQHKITFFKTIEECEKVKAVEQAKFDQQFGNEAIISSCIRYKEVDKEDAAKLDAEAAK